MLQPSNHKQKMQLLVPYSLHNGLLTAVILQVNTYIESGCSGSKILDVAACAGDGLLAVRSTCYDLNLRSLQGVGAGAACRINVVALLLQEHAQLQQTAIVLYLMSVSSRPGRRLNSHTGKDGRARSRAKRRSYREADTFAASHHKSGFINNLHCRISALLQLRQQLVCASRLSSTLTKAQLALHTTDEQRS